MRRGGPETAEVIGNQELMSIRSINGPASVGHPTLRVFLYGTSFLTEEELSSDYTQQRLAKTMNHTFGLMQDQLKTDEFTFTHKHDPTLDVSP